MYTHSNEPAKLCETVKTHKFKDFKDITKEQIIWTNNWLDRYLFLYCYSSYTPIEEIQLFFKKIRDFPLLENGKGGISYDAESLFINIPIKETSNICSESITTNMF